MTTPIPVLPVVMAGGSGTRLWPLSRSGYPKQFLVLAGETTLFQQAVQRLRTLAADDIALAAPLVVGNGEHRFLVLEQLREIGVEPGALLLEPQGRNTAPALTLAALQATEQADMRAYSDGPYARGMADAAEASAMVLDLLAAEYDAWIGA